MGLFQGGDAVASRRVRQRDGPEVGPAPFQGLNGDLLRFEDRVAQLAQGIAHRRFGASRVAAFRDQVKRRLPMISVRRYPPNGVVICSARTPANSGCSSAAAGDRRFFRKLAASFGRMEIESIGHARGARDSRPAAMGKICFPGREDRPRHVFRSDATPKPLHIPGADLAGIHVLRQKADAEMVRRAAAQARRANARLQNSRKWRSVGVYIPRHRSGQIGKWRLRHLLRLRHRALGCLRASGRSDSSACSWTSRPR